MPCAYLNIFAPNYPVPTQDARVVGATIMNNRAGEMLSELLVIIENGIHVQPFISQSVHIRLIDHTH